MAPPSVCIGRGVTKTRAKTRVRPGLGGLGLLFLGGGGDDGRWDGGHGGGRGGRGSEDWSAEDGFYGPYYEILWLWRLVCVALLGNTLRHSLASTPVGAC